MMKIGYFFLIYDYFLMKYLNQLTNTSDSIQPDGEHVYWQSFGPFWVQKSHMVTDLYTTNGGKYCPAALQQNVTVNITFSLFAVSLDFSFLFYTKFSYILVYHLTRSHPRCKYSGAYHSTPNGHSIFDKFKKTRPRNDY